VDILPDKVPEIFRSGMSANVDIVTQEKKNVLLLPQEALIEEGNQKFVLVKTPRGVIRKKVITGLYDDRNIEILKGVSKEEIVLISSQKYKLPTRKKVSSPFMPRIKKK